jgi:exodeoxyribonuclease VII small subunit
LSKDLSFNEALSRLETIVQEVKQKDISLDRSLDLLEEGVRLANICTEKTDHSYWREGLEESD